MTDVSSKDISIHLQGADFAVIKEMADDIARLPQWHVCLKWAPEEIQDGTSPGSVTLVAWRRTLNDADPYHETPILVHDQDAKGMARLQITENRRIIGV